MRDDQAVAAPLRPHLAGGGRGQGEQHVGGPHESVQPGCVLVVLLDVRVAQVVHGERQRHVVGFEQGQAGIQVVEADALEAEVNVHDVDAAAGRVPLRP